MKDIVIPEAKRAEWRSELERIDLRRAELLSVLNAADLLERNLSDGATRDHMGQHAKPLSMPDLILTILREGSVPMSPREILAAVQAKTGKGEAPSVNQAVFRLKGKGLVVKNDGKYRLT